MNKLTRLEKTLRSPDALLDTIVRLDDYDIMRLSHGHWYRAAGVRTMLARIADEIRAINEPSCSCTDRTPDGTRCRACGGRLPAQAETEPA